MLDVLEYVRAGNGPAAVEFDTERFYGHFEGDPQRYRGDGELDRIRADRDPLKAFREHIKSMDQVNAKDLDAIDQEVSNLIDKAVADAQSAPLPNPEDVTTDVYVSY